MNPSISSEIQAEQNHGRQKYGKGHDDFEHDDQHSIGDWTSMISAHNALAKHSTPMEARQHLVKVAGLAISAIESFDRKRMSVSIPQTRPFPPSIPKCQRDVPQGMPSCRVAGP